jgi:hypothetical protein
MYIGNRLLIFIRTNYNTQKSFAELLKIQESNLSRYIKKNTCPNIKMLNKFFNAGLSLDWLITGTGTMFADNTVGISLLLKLLFNENYIFSEFITRLESWILDNFESIDNFCEFNSIDKFYLTDIFIKNEIPGSNFVNLIENAGCNYKWVYSGTGSKYNTSPAGKILKLKEFSLNDLVNYINTKTNIKFDKKSIVSGNKYFDFLRTAIEIESSILSLDSSFAQDENILVFSKN